MSYDVVMMQYNCELLYLVQTTCLVEAQSMARISPLCEELVTAAVCVLF